MVLNVSDLLVLNSPINGLGVFAGRSFRMGDALLEIDDSRIVEDAHPLAPGDDPRHCDYLARKTVVLMQAPERHINHSCDPNSYVQTGCYGHCGTYPRERRLPTTIPSTATGKRSGPATARRLAAGIRFIQTISTCRSSCNWNICLCWMIGFDKRRQLS